MSLYNILNGVNPSTFLILPMLGKHLNEYPRFRDCFIEESQIVVLTRVGGNNRDCGFGEYQLYSHPNFVRTYDDDFDNTYGYYVFNVPNEWKDDFNKIVNGEKPSERYIEQMCKIFPKLEDDFKKLWNNEKEKEK